jgi:hypothetical protein
LIVTLLRVLKKTKPIVTQPEDDIIENLTVKSFDTHISPAPGANDKLAEPSSISSAQNVDIKGCSRRSETILKFIFLASSKRKVFETLADYCACL